MPRYTRRLRIGKGRKRMRGRGIGDFFSSINNFLKSSKLISGIGSMIPGVGGLVGTAAGALGYGRRVGRPCKRRLMGGSYSRS